MTSTCRTTSLLFLPVSLLYLLHQLISRKLSSDHHDQVLNYILSTVYIQQSTYHHWQTTGIHLRTSGHMQLR